MRRTLLLLCLAALVSGTSLIHAQECGTPQHLNVSNLLDCDLKQLYILTPKMETELDYRFELLQAQVLRRRESMLIKISDRPYLQSLLQAEETSILAVEAYDEDGFQLFQYWLPDKENLQILLCEWDYL